MLEVAGDLRRAPAKFENPEAEEQKQKIFDLNYCVQYFPLLKLNNFVMCFLVILY